MYKYRPANAEKQLVIKTRELFERPDDHTKHKPMISPILDHVGIGFYYWFTASPTYHPGPLSRSSSYKHLKYFSIQMDLPSSCHISPFRSPRDYLWRSNFYIDEAKIVAVQMLLGVKILPENGVMNLYLKPSNILVDSIEP